MSYRSPDIYFERLKRDDRVRALTEVRIDRPVFLGFTERGPIQEPTRIASWETFVEVFGDLTDDAYLPFAVHGFFRNGGDECFVTRVAKVSDDGDDDDDRQSARAASLTLRDVLDQPTIRIEALNEGSWGNQLKVRLHPPDRPQLARVKEPLEAGATSCRVDLGRGFQPGGIVKLTDGDREVHVELVDASRRELAWRDDQALDEGFDGPVVSVESCEWKLVITSAGERFEIHDGLSMSPRAPNYFVREVNEQSDMVRITDLESESEPPLDLPALETEFSLSGGSDGTDFVTPADFIGYRNGPADMAGLWAYEEIDDVGLVAAPDVHKARERGTGFREDEDVVAVQQALIDFCERNKTAFAVLDPPRGLDAEDVRSWRDRFDSKYAALYYPWIGIPDPLAPAGGEVRYLPPSGHVLGIYAKMDAEHGVHKAPANEVLSEVIALEHDVTKDTQDELNPIGVNVIRRYHGRGVRPWGARTLSSDAKWRYINVRRIFIMIERSIDEGMQWAVFEPNDPDLWKTLERMIGSFLYKLWRKGYMVGDTPEEGYYVKCDEETNPEENREVGQVLTEIGIAAVRPAEFIVVRIGQRTSDIITEEPVS